jgi:hypothetical protein
MIVIRSSIIFIKPLFFGVFAYVLSEIGFSLLLLKSGSNFAFESAYLV